MEPRAWHFLSGHQWQKYGWLLHSVQFVYWLQDDAVAHANPQRNRRALAWAGPIRATRGPMGGTTAGRVTGLKATGRRA